MYVNDVRPVRPVRAIRAEIAEVEMRLAALRFEELAALLAEGRRPGDGSDQPALFDVEATVGGQPKLF